MKTALKTTLLAAIFFGGCQLAFAQVTFGAKAGLNLATVMVSEDPELDPEMTITFQAGVIADIDISDNFAVQPGVLLAGKGFKLSGELFGEDFTSNIRPFYLHVPVNFLYKGDMFYVGAGPYASFGLFGSLKTEVAGESDSEDIEFGNSEDDFFSPLDFGANVEAGVILNNLRIGAGYALGLADIAMVRGFRHRFTSEVMHSAWPTSPPKMCDSTVKPPATASSA